VIDPFDVLHDELVRAAARATSEHRGELGFLRRRARPLLVLAAALVIGGSATAAIISLNQPTPGSITGTLPPAPHSPVAGSDYTITVYPKLLWAGRISWGGTIAYIRDGKLVGDLGVGGSPDDPIFPLFGASERVNTPVVIGEHVFFAFAGPGVAKVRLSPGGQLVTPRADPRLPPGIKGVVLVVPAHSPPLTIIPPRFDPPRPGQRYILLTPLDRKGHPIPLPGNPLHSTDFPTRNLSGLAQPANGACALAAQPLADLRRVSGSVATRISPRPRLPVVAFVGCISLQFQYRGAWFAASILLDARHPGRKPPPLPTATPVPSEPGVVNISAGPALKAASQAARQGPFSEEVGDITARREHNAWLAVQGGTLQQRLAILHALSIRRITTTQ
jgi:hypothetical protein